MTFQLQVYDREATPGVRWAAGRNEYSMLNAVILTYSGAHATADISSGRRNPAAHTRRDRCNHTCAHHTGHAGTNDDSLTCAERGEWLPWWLRPYRGP